VSNDILMQLRERVADPVSDEDLPEVIQPPLPKDDPRSRRGRRIPVAVTAFVILAAAGAAALFLGGDERTQGLIPGPLASASAIAAETMPADLEYTRTSVLTLDTTGNPPYSYYRPLVFESWVRSDGSGRLRTTHLPIEWPGARDRSRAVEADDQATLRLAGSSTNETVVDAELSAEELDAAFGDGSMPAATDLSADPAELRDQLVALIQGDGPKDLALFELASDVLLKPTVDPGVRGAAYEVLGRLPGVTVDQSVSDPEGRAATSASITSSATGAESTRTLYFDPDTAQTLAFTNTLTHPEAFIDAKTLTSVVMERNRNVSEAP